MNEKHWYVLRDLTRPNAKLPAYKQLQDSRYGLEKVFTPMVAKEYVVNGRKEVRKVPCLHDLLFAYSTHSDLKKVIDLIPTLQFRYVRGGHQNEAMIVPDDQMEAFIDVVTKAVDVEYYTPEQVPPSLYGKTIRIIGGQFDGRIGRLMTRRGSKTKRLIIDLQGILSAVVEVENQHIAIVEE